MGRGAGPVEYYSKGRTHLTNLLSADGDSQPIPVGHHNWQVNIKHVKKRLPPDYHGIAARISRLCARIGGF